MNKYVLTSPMWLATGMLCACSITASCVMRKPFMYVFFVVAMIISFNIAFTKEVK